MNRELVDRKHWIGQQQFLRALNFCMLLPGPEAQQLAIYIGWRLHRIRGGVVAGAFFVIPSIFVLLLLSWLAAAHGDVPAVRGLLDGVQPVVIAIVLDALLTIGKRSLRHPVMIVVALAAFVAIYFFHRRFPEVILAAALVGVALGRWWPRVVKPREEEHDDVGIESAGVEDESVASGALRNGKLVAAFALLWGLPFLLLLLTLGMDNVLTHELLFFTQAAFITFGGAYAVLSYITNVAVNDFHWLDSHQMVQGLGLAESTPGPLIMVTQYVGFFGAWNNHGSLPQLPLAIAGALITTYITFLPCFFYIFLGAPYIEALSNNRALSSALAGVGAAVVGVIANLAVFFAVRVLYSEDHGLDFFALGLAAVAFAVIKQFRAPIHLVVPGGALAGMAWVLLR